MKPDFAKMPRSELTAYVLSHREDMEALEALVNRRTPDSEATWYPAPCTPEGEPIEENIRIMEEAIRGRIEEIERRKQERMQSLEDVAIDIQKLLEQLEETYPINATIGKMQIAAEAIATLENDPILTQRIVSAVKDEKITELERFLNHPAAKFAIAALEDWLQNKI